MDIFAPRVNGRNLVARCQRNKLIPQSDKKRFVCNNEAIGVLLAQACKGYVKIALSYDVQVDDLPSNSARRRT